MSLIETSRPGAAIIGVILAGGRSSRFGSNKALAPLAGKPLICHVAETMTICFTTCLLVTNTPAIYEFLNLPMTADLYADAGPLAGLQAALRYARSQRFSWCFTVACDMPRLDRRLIRLLCGLIPGDTVDAVIPCSPRGLEPLCGLYHIRILPIIEECLRQKTGKISQVVEQLQVRRVGHEEILRAGLGPAVFHNVNSPADLPA